MSQPLETSPNAAPKEPPKVAPVTGLRRQLRRAAYWATIGWNLYGPNRGRSIFVIGYPRTGTNWFSRIMSGYFDLPRYMARDQPLPVTRTSVLHLHRFTVVPSRTIYMVRDPRDVAVSYYHKAINTNRPSLIARIARSLPEPFLHENLHANLEAFIRLTYAEDIGGSIPFDQHTRRAREQGLYTVRYEDVLARGEEAVGGAVAHLSGGQVDPERVRKTLDEMSFEKKTGRKRGEEDLRWASVRKGVAGDWKNHFTRETARVFQECDPGSLVALGYEQGDDWPDALPESLSE